MQRLFESPAIPKHRSSLDLYDAIVPARLDGPAVETPWPKDSSDDFLVKSECIRDDQRNLLLTVTVGNTRSDQREWTPLKSCPYDYDQEMPLTRVLGNVSGFESRTGKRYRCVIENGRKQWFTFRTNRRMKRATRAEVKICCKEFRRSFGTFVDRYGNGLVRIFPKSSGLTGQLSSGISFCPWCGKELEFLKEGKVESRVRTAKA